MGYNRTWLLALRYISNQYGGLSLRNLKIEALIKKILAIQYIMEKTGSYFNGANTSMGLFTRYLKNMNHL